MHSIPCHYHDRSLKQQERNVYKRRFGGVRVSRGCATMYLSLSVLSVSLLAARSTLGKLFTEPSQLRSTTYDYVIVGGRLMLSIASFLGDADLHGTV